MLSYRHIFHAGNHADVLKHATLALALDYLVSKEKPLWYVDTHAGAGSYRLDAAEARKTGEFAEGIERLLGGDTPAELALYLEAVRRFNGQRLNAREPLSRYPGSPALAAQWLRPGDRLKLFELHPQDGPQLARQFQDDRRVEVRQHDGFDGLKSLLPPPPRRALVLIDPPYEVKTDYERLIAVLRDARKRFATGVYLVWYPLLNRPEVERLGKRLEALGAENGDWLRAELRVSAAGQGLGMYGSGVFLLNPPWRLREQLEALLPWLVQRLGDEHGDWLVRGSTR